MWALIMLVVGLKMIGDGEAATAVVGAAILLSALASG